MTTPNALADLDPTPEQETWFLLTYHCPECGDEWEDTWFHTVNCDCPNCHIEVEPSNVEELPQ
jgi:hypothetical protein